MSIKTFLASLREHTYTPNEFYDEMVKYIGVLEAMFNGDVVIGLGFKKLTDVELATINAGGLTQPITVTLKNSDGDVLEAFSGTLPFTAAGSVGGLVENDSGSQYTTLTFNRGTASATLHFVEDVPWVNEETCTVTVGAGGKIAGNTLTQASGITLTCEAAG